MLRLLLVISLGFVVSCSDAAPPVAEPAAPPTAAVAASPAGWRSLFNGRDLSGWDGDPRMWSVRDGVVHGETTPDAKADGNTFLICK